MAAETGQIQTATPRKRLARLQTCDIEAVARLMAEKRMSMEESLALLQIPEGTFKSWQSRNGNSQTFATIVTRIRAAKINNVIDSIDKAGDPFVYTANGKEYQKPGDWRAKAWIAERALAPDRYGQQQSTTSQQQAVINVGDSAIRAILDRCYSQPAAQVECPPAKALPEQAKDNAC